MKSTHCYKSGNDDSKNGYHDNADNEDSVPPLPQIIIISVVTLSYGIRKKTPTDNPDKKNTNCIHTVHME